MSPQRKPRAKAQPAVEPVAAAPTRQPPDAERVIPGSQSRPTELPATRQVFGEWIGPAMPTKTPPAEALAPKAAGAWVNGKKVEGVWTINEDRNGFVYISEVGWKKLANTSDSAFAVLNLLASHALQTQGLVDFRDEADGMIHELYVW